MIAGIGIDLIEVARVEEKILKEIGFREYVFSQAEINYCISTAHPGEHYAARFAAKEAFLKALGTGWKNGISFHEIEVINNEEGKPLLHLSGNTDLIFKENKFTNIFLSISHLKSVAAAVVILEM